MATIAVLGTLDTKGAEHAYVAELIRQRGHQTLLIDTGSGEPPSVQPDIANFARTAPGNQNRRLPFLRQALKGGTLQ